MLMSWGSCPALNKQNSQQAKNYSNRYIWQKGFFKKKRLNGVLYVTCQKCFLQAVGMQAYDLKYAGGTITI
jgi:hypothetical protein